MPVPTFTGMGPNPSFDDVTKKINTLVMELRNLMLGLDTLNIIELNASVITALSITADKIGAGEITTEKLDALAVTTAKLDALAVTAAKINVSQLSAISADMGTINAGSITTNASINVGTNATIGNNLNMGVSSFTGSKKIVWSTDFGISAELEVTSGDMSIRTDGFITLTIGSSQGLVVNKVVAASALKSNTITNNSGVSVVFSGSSTSSHIQGNHNHGIPNGTVLMVDGGGTVTFVESGGFTHNHTVT